MHFGRQSFTENELFMVIRLDMLDVSFVVSSKLQHVYTVSTNAYVISPLCKWFGLEAKIIMLRFVSEEITEMAEIKKNRR